MRLSSPQNFQIMCADEFAEMLDSVRHLQSFHKTLNIASPSFIIRLNLEQTCRPGKELHCGNTSIDSLISFNVLAVL